MTNPELLGYIRNQLQQGFTKEKITNDLLTNGWAAQDVKEAFEKLTPILSGTPIFPTNKKTKKWDIKSIWFWWLFTSFVYLFLNLMGYPNINGSLADVSLMSHIAGFVGLFVPYGMTSAIITLSPFGALSLAVFGVLMNIAQSKLDKLNLKFIIRILIILLILMLITMAVDFVRMTPLESWNIFITGRISISSM